MKVKEAGETGWEYAYTYKLVVALRSLGKTESKQVQELVDQLYAPETASKLVTDDQVMEARTAGKIVSFIRLTLSLATGSIGICPFATDFAASRIRATM